MKQNQVSLKQKIAYAVLNNIQLNPIIGLGSGSTVGYFIEALATIKHPIEGVVAASVQTENQLKSIGIPILDLNTIDKLSIYIDSTDEVNSELQLIKGGGGALTREKIIAAVSQCFICIADEAKYVKLLGQRAVPIEVIPMARSYVAREIVKLGGFPIYRENFITDNGNVILDTKGWDFTDPIRLERLLNNISGTVCNGVFAQRPADQLLLANNNEVKLIKR